MGVLESFEFAYLAIALSIMGIATAIASLYIMNRRRERYLEHQFYLEPVGDGQKLKDIIFSLLKDHGDVELRLLVELYEGEDRRFYGFTRESQKVRTLRSLQDDLRKSLKEAIKSKEHYNLKDNIISLIDESEKEISSLLERKPFEDIADPEKALLIDILEELPIEKQIPKQKLLQLADILKNKYQNIEKLQIENQKSAKWTRWGAFGTLFFGILSLILSL